MRLFRSIAGACLLASCFMGFTASAGETIERNPVYRSVNSNWTDIGSTAYPFKNIFAETVNLGGTLLTAPYYGLAFTNTLTLAPGSTAYVTNLGIIAGYWTFQAAIPAGANGANGINGSNVVTATVFTNSVLSSVETTLTNINPLNFSGSNFIGQFPQFYDFVLNTPFVGGGGLLPNTNLNEVAYISLTGTNGWFAATSPAAIFTNVWVSVSGVNGYSGSIEVFGIDHPELCGRTNSYFGQYNQFPNPILPNDAANKGYVDMAVANTLSPFLTSTDTNGIFHVSYAHLLNTLVDITSAGGWIKIDGFIEDSTKTNGLLTIAATNLLAGWTVQGTTNLSLDNGWSVYTNYTMATNSGEVTFTVPLNMAAQFFRAMIPTVNVFNVNGAPVTVNGAPVTGGGTIQLYATTNTPAISTLGNQKGGLIWVSNGTFYVTGSTDGATTYTKEFAP